MTAQWARSRDISDHCSIILSMGNQQWGPKPFWFNNCWLSNAGLAEVVLVSWSNANFVGCKAFMVKEKFKSLKSAFRAWNLESFGDINGKIKQLESSISVTDLKAEEGSLSESDLECIKKILC